MVGFCLSRGYCVKIGQTVLLLVITGDLIYFGSLSDKNGKFEFPCDSQCST